MSGNSTPQASGSLFSSLDERQVAELASMFAARTYRKGEPFFAVGEKVETMYLLRRGRVQLFVENNLGERVVLKEVVPGDQFGEAALLDGGTNPFSARAAEDAEVLILRREDLAEILGRFPGAAMALLTTLCRQLRAATGRLGEQTPSTLENQLDRDHSVGTILADRLATLAGSPKFFLALGFLLAIAMYISRVPSPWITGSIEPVNPDYTYLNLALTILGAIQGTLILLVLNRSADRTRLMEGIDLEFKSRVESSLGQMNAKLDRNQQEIRLLLAETRAVSAGTRPPARAS